MYKKILNKLKFSFFSFTYEMPSSELKNQYYSLLYSYVSARFETVSISESIIEFTVRQLFHIPYKITLKCKQDAENTRCSFRIDHANFIAVSVIVLLFAALFSRTSFLFFLWFSGGFLLGFYVIHYIFFSSLCRRIHKQIRIHEVLDDILSKEQIAWIENPFLCSACGAEITKYHSHCPECGIFIKQQHISPHSSTESNYKITYTYVESYEMEIVHKTEMK